MILNLIQALVLFSVTISLFIFITLLPAFVELKKPKDKGPRMIMETMLEGMSCFMYNIPIENIEKEQKFDVSIIHAIANVIEALPNLDV